MRVVLVAVLFFVSALFSPAAQQAPPNSSPVATPDNLAPQQDAQAIALLRNAVTTMGGSIPSDTSATGTIVVVAGTETQNGSIRALTRGTDQTVEETNLREGVSRVVYSRGAAAVPSTNSDSQPASMELAASSQSTIFPLPLLVQALSSADVTIEFVGTEDIDGASCQHVRTWNTFASHPKIQFLSEFTHRDFWIETQTGLLKKLAYQVREAGGAAPRIAMDVYYDDYRKIGSNLYPFLIKKSFNGTPWTTITIQNITTNTGLTDSAFPVQ